MIAPARKFSCLSMPSARIREQSNPQGQEGRGFGDNVLLAALVRLFAANAPRPSSARKTPARTINRPIKTRRLKKADCEADFFFIELVESGLHSTLRYLNAAA